MTSNKFNSGMFNLPRTKRYYEKTRWASAVRCMVFEDHIFETVLDDPLTVVAAVVRLANELNHGLEEYLAHVRGDGRELYYWGLTEEEHALLNHFHQKIKCTYSSSIRSQRETMAYEAMKLEVPPESRVDEQLHAILKALAWVKKAVKCFE